MKSKVVAIASYDTGTSCLENLFVLFTVFT